MHAYALRVTSSCAAALLLAGCERGAPRRAAVAAGGRAALEGTRTAPYRCGVPLAPVADASGEIRKSYADWTERYVTADGAGNLLRVRMPEAGDNTSSEGMGYGMLLAAYVGDRETFAPLWGYARRYHNANGLMAWEVSPEGRMLDENSATDGDEDMAFALLVADARWGGYAAPARALIASLMAHAVEPGTHVFKPGDVWGGSMVVNPSYLAPAYYKAFAAAGGDATWERVADASYAILDRVVTKQSPAAGLQPDWATAAGDSAPGSTGPGDDGFEFAYGYGATRVPWRLAMDAAWSCDPRALRHLTRLNAFFRRVGPEEILDGYALDGRAVGKWHNAAFVAPVMTAALFAEDPGYRRSLWRETVSLRHDEYYHDALRLLSLLLGGGHMPPLSAFPAAGG